MGHQGLVAPGFLGILAIVKTLHRAYRFSKNFLIIVILNIVLRRVHLVLIAYIIVC